MRRKQEGRRGFNCCEGHRSCGLECGILLNIPPPCLLLSSQSLTSQLKKPASCCSSAPSLSAPPRSCRSWPRFVGEAVTRVQTGTEQPGAHGGVGGRADAGCWGILGSAVRGAGWEEDETRRSQKGVLVEGAAQGR